MKFLPFLEDAGLRSCHGVFKEGAIKGYRYLHRVRSIIPSGRYYLKYLPTGIGYGILFVTTTTNNSMKCVASQTLRECDEALTLLSNFINY